MNLRPYIAPTRLLHRPRSARSLALHLLSGARRYAPAFGVEVLLFYGCLLLYEVLSYGGRPHPSPPFTGPTPYYIVIGALIVTLAMGAAEAHFRLYRRVWAVAGLGDAIAIGLAVAEATVLVTAANAIIPGDFRPFRILGPPLAAPSGNMTTRTATSATTAP